jgi:hypothetical protein
MVCVGSVQGGSDGSTSGDQDKGKAVTLCDLALALVPTLDEAGTALLYKVGPWMTNA